jgi:tRNA pseudouridine synthase 10
MPLHVCALCVDKIDHLFGGGTFENAASRGAVTAIGGDTRGATQQRVCHACMGVLQLLQEHCAALTEAIRSSPFHDCRKLAVSPSVPRIVAFTFPAVCLAVLQSTGRVRDNAHEVEMSVEAALEGAIEPLPPTTAEVASSSSLGSLGHGGDAVMDRVVGHASSISRRQPVPEAIWGFVKDAAVVELLAAVERDIIKPSQQQQQAGDHHHHHHKQKRSRDRADEAHPTQWARVDETDTIVADVFLNIHSAESATLPTSTVAFIARRATEHEQVRAAIDSRAALGEMFVNLPAELRSNKCTMTFTWELIEGKVLPAVIRDTRLTLRAELASDVWRTPIFVFGHYRKMSRDISQSPWFVGGARIGRASLQEVIAQYVLPAFYSAETLAKRSGTAHSTHVPQPTAEANGDGRQRGGTKGADDDDDAPAATAGVADHATGTPLQFTEASIFGGGLYKFHSAGREDVDVRMLGAGRPFVLELESAHRGTISPAELRAIAQALNDESADVEVDDLSIVHDRAVMNMLHRMSEEKRKKYRCVCYSSRALRADDALFAALNATKELTMQQKTPLRVLHRRSMLTRPRTIHTVDARLINEHWFVVDLETQAGAYIKEFCHGDMGRTTPSLGDLLHSVVDIVQLDVVGVECGVEAMGDVARLEVVRSDESRGV